MWKWLLLADASAETYQLTLQFFSAVICQTWRLKHGPQSPEIKSLAELQQQTFNFQRLKKSFFKTRFEAHQSIFKPDVIADSTHALMSCYFQ